MNLPKALSYNLRSIRGFTLLEVLLAGALIAALTALVSPWTIAWYRLYQLHEASATLEQTLRRAQANARYQWHDTSFGIAFQTNQYVLFEGDSYASRTQSQDYVTALPGAVTVSGLSEVVFASNLGTPNATGTITLSIDTRIRQILVHSTGLIERL